MPPALMRDLIGAGVPADIVAIWEDKHGTTLLPIQQRVLASGVLDRNESALVIAPTSAGKTFVAEIAAVRKALSRQRVVFLVPFKALAEEHYADFVAKYGRFGVEIVISTGDHRATDSKLRAGAFDIAIMTYEKLTGLLVHAPDIIGSHGLLVIDEMQMLADRTRGPRLELLIAKLLQRTERPQILGLSAVIKDPNGLDEWMGTRVIRDDHRPIALREGTYAPDGTYTYVDKEAGAGGVERWPAWEDESVDDAVVALVRHLVTADEQVLVFCASVESTVELARSIANVLPPYPAAHNVLRELRDLDDTGLKPILEECVARGAAFHSSHLTLEERRAVEAAYREGGIAVVCATSTLSAGVNLPARTVILRDDYAWGDGGKIALPVASYRNMAGRAGRYRYRDAFGRAVLIGPTELDYERAQRQYIDGEPEAMRSQLADGDIDRHVLDVVAAGLAETAAAASDLLSRTFEGFHRWRGADERKRLASDVARAISELEAQGCIAVTAETCEATSLGRICIVSGMSPRSAGRLRGAVTGSPPASMLDVLRIATSIEEAMATGGYRSSTADYNARRWLATAEVGDLADAAEWCRRWGLAWPDYDTYNRIRAILDGMGWASGRRIRELERATGRRAGVLRARGEQLGWIVGVMADIAAIEGCGQEVVTVLEDAAERLEYGVSGDGIELAREQVPGVGRERIMRLVDGGLAGVSQILDAEAGQFRGVLPGTVAANLRSVIEERYAAQSERKRREHRRRMEAAAGDAGLVDRLYTEEGERLELVVRDVLVACTGINVERITKQNEGEPDLLVGPPNDLTVVSVTARQGSRGPVSMRKAVEIIGTAARFMPTSYLVVGRPGFDRLALRAAADHVAAGRAFKLIPVPSLAEIFVELAEGRLERDSARNLLMGAGPVLTDSMVVAASSALG